MKNKNKHQPIYYTYLIGWTHLDVWYYGSKYSKYADPELLWVKYFTSSKRVAEFRKLHGEPDIVEIGETNFKTPQECRIFEYLFLTSVDAAKRERWLNESNGNGKFHTSGWSWRYDEQGNKYYVSPNDYRVKNGELKIKDIDSSTYSNYNPEYYLLNKEQFRVANHKYYEENKEKIKKKSLDLYYNNRDNKISQNKDRYHNKTVEERKEQNQRYYENNQQKNIERARQYRKKKKEELKNNLEMLEEYRRKANERAARYRNKKKASVL
jgi:hypothetical protein